MAAEKARFYLEQSIPELQDYEKKNVFTKVINQFVAPLFPVKELTPSGRNNCYRQKAQRF
jgi:hypothetical protein